MAMLVKSYRRIASRGCAERYFISYAVTFEFRHMVLLILYSKYINSFLSDAISYCHGLDRFKSCVCCWNFAFFIFLTGESVNAAHRAFRAYFKLHRNYAVPRRKSILQWVEDFSVPGSGFQRKPSGRLRSACTSRWWKTLKIIWNSICWKEAAIFKYTILKPKWIK